MIKHDEYLTIRDRFKDNTGKIRYANVSWPIFTLKDFKYIVKDVDGSYFEVEYDNAIISPFPSRLVNMSTEDYIYYSRTPQISDFNKAYKELFGIDQSINTRAQHSHGVFDEELKKKHINGSYEGVGGKGIRESILYANADIED